MRTPRVLLSLLAVFLPFGVAAQAPSPVSGPSREDVNMAAVLRVAGMEKVEVRSDLVYETVGDTQLAVDLYRPPDAPRSARPPVLILVAGGAENPKGWGVYRSLGRLFAASGFVTAAFNHRLRYPRRQYEEGAADLVALMDYFSKNGPALGLDPGRVAVMTFSGGGPMLSVVLRERPRQVRCIAAFYSFLDTEHVDPSEAGTVAAVVRKFSPLLQLRANPAGMPPLFIARGGGGDEIPGVERFHRSVRCGGAGRERSVHARQPPRRSARLRAPERRRPLARDPAHGHRVLARASLNGGPAAAGPPRFSRGCERWCQAREAAASILAVLSEYLLRCAAPAPLFGGGRAAAGAFDLRVERAVGGEPVDDPPRELVLGVLEDDAPVGTLDEPERRRGRPFGLAQ